MLIVVSGPTALNQLRGMNIRCIVTSVDLTSVNLMKWVAERLILGKDVGVATDKLDAIDGLSKLAVECGRGFLSIKSIDPRLN